MEVNRKSCHLASLVVLIIFTTFPVKCLTAGDAYTPARENTQLKRFADDYDSFMGLMGKRRATPGLNIADHILADLLQPKTRECPVQPVGSLIECLDVYSCSVAPLLCVNLG
uniref:Neuromedin-K n=1 Tax=Fundulus heteroclitus TaxID=8078 RepID=A0A3Q2PI16_FUNHE